MRTLSTKNPICPYCDGENIEHRDAEAKTRSSIHAYECLDCNGKFIYKFYESWLPDEEGKVTTVFDEDYNVIIDTTNDSIIKEMKIEDFEDPIDMITCINMNNILIAEWRQMYIELNEKHDLMAKSLYKHVFAGVKYESDFDEAISILKNAGHEISDKEIEKLKSDRLTEGG